MRTLRIYTLFLLISVASLSFAVTLPSFPCSEVNELYETSKDNIEMSTGITVGKINLQILTAQSEWGEICLGQGEQGLCQDCCKDKLLTAQDGYTSDNVKKYTTCIKDCGGGESLPLGSALWLMPFAFAYGIIKRYNNKKADF